MALYNAHARWTRPVVPNASGGVDHRPGGLEEEWRTQLDAADDDDAQRRAQEWADQLGPVEQGTTIAVEVMAAPTPENPAPQTKTVESRGLAYHELGVVIQP